MSRDSISGRRPMGGFLRAIGACAALGAMFSAPAVCAQSQAVVWGFNYSGESDVPAVSLLPYRAISAGDWQSIGLLADGSVRMWGSNGYGQLNAPAGLGVVQSVASGAAHCVALTIDGRVWCWGAGLTAGGGYGNLNHGQSMVPADLGTAIAIAAGDAHTVALLSGGLVRCWGSGSVPGDPDGSFGYDQCIVPEGLGAVTAIAAGDFHTMAIGPGGTAVCWGRNDSGQSSVPSDVGPVTRLAGGSFHSLAVRADGTVRAWGDNGALQCDVPVDLPPVRDVAAGIRCSMALLMDGTVRVWGSTTMGEGDVPPGTFAALSVGERHGLALRTDGSVVGWGDDGFGQASVPRAAGRMRCLSGGGGFLAAVGDDGSYIAWGENYRGQCKAPAGLGSLQSVAAGAEHVVALRADGTVAAWGAGLSDAGWGTEFGQSIVPADLGPAVARVAAGYAHSIAIRGDGSIRCWGRNGSGECNVPAGLGPAVDIDGGGSFMGSHTVALLADGSVHCWGAGTVDTGNFPDFGQSIVPPDLGPSVAVAAGDYHTAALQSDGHVRCWGWWALCDVPSDLEGVTAISAGSRQTLALLADGSVRAWGPNGWAPCQVPSGMGPAVAVAAANYASGVLLSPAASGCSNPGAAGVATVFRSGSGWQDVGTWRWTSGGGPQVPGALTTADLGAYGSVGSTCDAECAVLVARSGSSLIVPVDLSLPSSAQDHSIDVGGVANMAGRVWLLGSGASVLPADLDIPVLRAGTPSGTFDIIQTSVPPPPGKFLALVPQAGATGQTTYSLRLLDLPGNGSLTGTTTGSFSGEAVAAEAMDWNGDGFDDLALAVSFGPSLPGTLQVLLNDGQGNLGGTSVQVQTPALPTCMAVGPIDGDGRTDVAVGCASDSSVRLYLNNFSSFPAGPAFVQGTPIAANGVPLSVVVIAATSVLPTGGSIGVGSNGSGGSLLTMYSSQTSLPTSSVQLSVSPDTCCVRGTKVATGGGTATTLDGLLPAGQPGGLQVVEPGANGQWAVVQTIPVPGKPVAIDFADIDGDGIADVVTANADPVLQGAGTPLPVLTLFRGGASGLGNAVPIAPDGGSAGVDVSLVDIDADGDRDVVTVERASGTQTKAVSIRIDTTVPGGPLTLGTETQLPSTRPILCTRGNLDGTGGDDLYLVDAGSGASFVSDASSAVPQVRPYLGVLPSAPPCPGDLDHDGAVNGADLGILLSQWGIAGSADLNSDGVVNGADLGVLLSVWGACAGT